MHNARWRRAAAVCLSLLLPLPLVLLLRVLQERELPTDTALGGTRILPMLDTDRRLRLMTYRHECMSGADCEPPLGCLFEARYNQAYCTDSQCLTDAQCPEGQFCRALVTKEQGLRVRICIPPGERQEGEFCDPAPQDKGHACAAELVCSGNPYHWCGRPCRPGVESTGCPPGFFCAETLPEPTCLPTCAGRECSQGQRCVVFPEGASVCARVYGPSCWENPCPEGQACRALTEPTRPDTVWMECIERCGPGAPPCGPGNICDVWQCLPECTPEEQGTCAEGFRCQQRGPDSPFACRPDDAAP